ncbi:TetR/AcrR family transcriptional regulator [Cystobacter fuscus]
MGRISGARNRDHEETRSKLAQSLAQQLLLAGGTHPSLRTLAEGAGVDPGTLRHYFGDRQGVMQAAFEHLMKFGQERRAWAKSRRIFPRERPSTTCWRRSPRPGQAHWAACTPRASPRA